MYYKNLFKILIPISFSIISICLIFSIYDKNQHRELVIISPDTDETKIKPLDRGGIVIPNSENIVYDTLNNQSFTKRITLLPEPEQAIKLNDEPTLGDDFNTIDQMLTKVMAHESKAEDSSSNDLAVGDNIFEEDLAIFDNTETTTPQVVNDEAPTNKTLNIIKVTDKSSKINKAPSSASNSSNNYKIQLATVKSESQGLLEGERIKRKHSKILSTSNVTLKKVQHENGHFFYLVLAGDYSSSSKAKGICKKLSARQQPCMIFKF